MNFFNTTVKNNERTKTEEKVILSNLNFNISIYFIY